MSKVLNRNTLKWNVSLFLKLHEINDEFLFEILLNTV